MRREITQDEFLPEVTGSKKVICHFYSPEFMRCKIMDKVRRMPRWDQVVDWKPTIFLPLPAPGHTGTAARGGEIH
jgi:hypothetical protein